MIAEMRAGVAQMIAKMNAMFAATALLDVVQMWPKRARRKELDVNEVRKQLVESREMAFPVLCYTALEHAAEGVTHLDEKIFHAYTTLTTMSSKDKEEQKNRVVQAGKELKEWFQNNRCKAVFMVVGLGGTAFKAKTIGTCMKNAARAFIDYAYESSTMVRFFLFVLLMIVRLFVSTLVPPTSPGFSIILQAATPPSQKWTAMPLFLLASTAAGAFPYCIDMALQACFREDFKFTIFMHDFAAVWPLTCWTKPAMEKVFIGARGGQLGASAAVIFAHAAPFMGAQTTMMQRYFLPHPLDTILSQPFGMSEDLISMAMAEAGSNPGLASHSLTGIICMFNFAELLFKGCGDMSALTICAINLSVGFMFAYFLPSAATLRTFLMVFMQLLVQMLVGPYLGRVLTKYLTNCCCEDVDKLAASAWVVPENAYPPLLTGSEID